MYDWNALWHAHQAHLQQLASQQLDVNQLGAELHADLRHPAKNLHDVAAYDAGDHFLLLRHDEGLQMLKLDKRQLFDIGIRLVTADEGLSFTLPYLEVLIDNLATGEEAIWRAEVDCSAEGELLANGEVLEADRIPAISLPPLSFIEDERFHLALLEAWQESAEGITLDAAAWFNTEALEDAELDAPLDSRIQQMCDRYAEIIRREQALLSRRFNDAELMLIAEVLRGVSFETAESCRGLWLAVESRILHEELDHKHEVNGEALLDKLKQLGYTQEVALIEALAPRDA